MRTPRQLDLTCEQCGKAFVGHRLTRRYCSKSCGKKARGESGWARTKAAAPDRNCEQCDQPFKGHWPTSRFCSSACWGRDQAGTGEGKTYPKLNGRHEHRVVAEQMLGRALLSGEVVHHIDGDRQNNDPSNLMVLSSQAAHARLHKELEKGAAL